MMLTLIDIAYIRKSLHSDYSTNCRLFFDPNRRQKQRFFPPASSLALPEFLETAHAHFYEKLSNFYTKHFAHALMSNY
jgi:hypothetical protein